MSSYDDLGIAELEARMEQLHAESDIAFKRCNNLVASIDARHREDKTRSEKIAKLIAERKAIELAPHLYFAAQKLPGVELKLKVAKYDLERKVDECKRLKAKHMIALKSELCFTKEKTQLAKTVDTLTAQLERKASLEDQQLQAENDKLKEELAGLKMQLMTKTEECRMKNAHITSQDQDIEELRKDFITYQSVTSDNWAHRHDSCDELVTALEEQCSMLTTQHNTLKSNVQTLETNIDTLHHKVNTLTMERDELQGNLDDAIKAHKLELEDLDSIKCDGSSSCTSCVLHLGRALHNSRATEAEALRFVDRVNHDRIVAWNQLHKHLTMAVREHYASAGPWVEAHQSSSPSPTFVSPTFNPGENCSGGWKISDICGSSEGGSIEFAS